MFFLGGAWYSQILCHICQVTMRSMSPQRVGDGCTQKPHKACCGPQPLTLTSCGNHRVFLSIRSSGFFCFPTQYSHGIKCHEMDCSPTPQPMGACCPRNTQVHGGFGHSTLGTGSLKAIFCVPDGYQLQWCPRLFSCASQSCLMYIWRKQICVWVLHKLVEGNVLCGSHEPPVPCEYEVIA